MTVIIVGLLAFILGYGFGGASYINKIRSGRVEIGGRIYFCKDTGPKVR